MIFGVSTACLFPNFYIEDAIGLLGGMSVQNIEVFFSCMAEYKTPFVKQLKAKADDNGMRICSVHAYSLAFEPQLFSRHERARSEALGIYQTVLEAGAALGAESYVFHGPAHMRRSQALVLDYDAIAEKADPLCALAKAHGIRLAWENVHYCWYHQPDFPEKILPRLDSDNLWFTLDIKQAAQAGYNPALYVQRACGKLATIHVCDYVSDLQLGILPKLPFEGCMDFHSLKQVLIDEGFDGPMMLEVYEHNISEPSDLKRSLKDIQDFFNF